MTGTRVKEPDVLIIRQILIGISEATSMPIVDGFSCCGNLFCLRGGYLLMRQNSLD